MANLNEYPAGKTYAIFVKSGRAKSGRNLGQWTASFNTPEEAHEAAKHIKGKPYTMQTTILTDPAKVGYSSYITYL